MTPKVSVVTPVYNAEKYLEKCLDSVLGQTLSPIEMICVNDGSTDASPEILARYAAEHDNLRVLHQENSGPAVARNAALDIAQGEYILFVDSDDWLLRSDILEALYTQAAELELDELFFNTEVSYEDEDTHAKNRRFDRLYQRKHPYPDVLDGPSMFDLLSRNGDYVSSIWSRLYRRAFLEEHHMRLQPGNIHDDEFFSMKCICLERRAGYRDLACYGRHVHPGSIMTGSKLSLSAYCYLSGILDLDRFEREQLAGAGALARKRFRWRRRVIANMATEKYRAISPEERRELMRKFAPGERPRVRRALLGGALRLRTRKLRRKIWRKK